MTAGEAFRKAFSEAYEDVEEPGYAALLDQAVAVLDAIEAMQSQIDADGLVVQGSRGQPTSHPLLSEVRAQRLVLAKLLDVLDLDEPEEAAGRRAGSDLAKRRWQR